MSLFQWLIPEGPVHTDFKYPTPLRSMRGLVAIAAEPIPGFFPGIAVGRLPACLGYKSGCESPYCPACSRRSHFKLEKRLTRVARRIPTTRLLFATFITADCPIDELRFTVKEVSAAGRKMLRGIASLHGWFMRQEVSWHARDLFHAHLHILLDAKQGYHSGRNCMSEAKWRDRWLSLLPEDLHNVQSRTAVIQRLGTTQEDRQRTLHYICKSPWEGTEGDSTEGLEEAAFAITDQIKATARLRRYASSGTLSIPTFSSR